MKIRIDRSGADIETVLVNSEIVIENGRSTRVEESELFAQAEILAKRAWDNWPSRDWGARRSTRSSCLLSCPPELIAPERSD
ncbi:MAG: hypothetical protein E6J89_13455 [Deltaproteobacteria bacterium]|nr:MAG: hypothetical protein E6J89_13455 [Deltaproteobacteria bacterium]